MSAPDAPERDEELDELLDAYRNELMSSVRRAPEGRLSAQEPDRAAIHAYADRLKREAAGEIVGTVILQPSGSMHRYRLLVVKDD